nr:glycosyltransferase family 92 protein F13G3.3-like [Labrus bergylta]
MVSTIIFILYVTGTSPVEYISPPRLPEPPKVCPVGTAEHTITPLNNTDHFLVSAFMDQRKPEDQGNEEKKLQFNFTVCISNLFGGINNVLQFVQTLEMYRLLGVDRVVIYNTSCGPELDLLLKSYNRTGFLEIVPWPIDLFLSPSWGWLYSVSGGDVHYFGQLATLNECVYRSMDRSRYVLLNDIDEIIMPYQHNNLMSLMNTLQQQHPNTGVFLIENHIFPKTVFEPSKRFHLPKWDKVPGVNILEHIYREDPDRTKYHPHKLIVQPRLVEQVSVHDVLKAFGTTFKVPPDVCRIIHVRVYLRGKLDAKELNEDKRLWDFNEKLIPSVDKALERAGLLRSEPAL